MDEPKIFSAEGKIELYEGVTRGTFEEISFDIDKALNQNNPRNVFLNGQLYIEQLCDVIIRRYFSKGDVSATRYVCMYEFLNSGDITFKAKINFLKLLENEDDFYCDEKGIVINRKLIGSKLITSILAIGEIRNAFQHNLIREDAMAKVKKGGKFAYLNKSLKNYDDINELVKDFKIEVKEVYHKLHMIVLGR